MQHPGEGRVLGLERVVFSLAGGQLLLDHVDVPVRLGQDLTQLLILLLLLLDGFLESLDLSLQ